VSRTIAIFCGPWPVLKRARSSLKITSKTQWRRFSTPMGPHGAGEGQGANGKRAQIVTRFAFNLAVAFDLGFDCGRS
jgi:hypothetical protein